MDLTTTSFNAEFYALAQRAGADGPVGRECRLKEFYYPLKTQVEANFSADLAARIELHYKFTTREIPIQNRDLRVRELSTGDPTGKGTGGESVHKLLFGEQSQFFEDEIRPELKHSKRGIVTMASAGKNLNASQFYITLRDNIDYLDGKQTVFGELGELIPDASPEGKPKDEMADVRLEDDWVPIEEQMGPAELEEVLGCAREYW
ncbi:hypothetical protein IFM89_015901 [Coptis chinensis]|uniref:PPIase cyclophilin-type domain-containing protein n=1 Tax=Coptis chinensis TaxID=261450 RepID=A0A835HQU2_9MAGN|nr:hypothetical protein IFM89_015901 [Coptis chinensis]